MSLPKSRFVILISVIFFVFFSLQVTFVQGVRWETTKTVSIGANQKHGSTKNCSAGDTLEIQYNVEEGPAIDAYLMNGGNGSNFMTGESFSFKQFNENSRSGSWSYTVTYPDYYGIYINNNNNEEVTVWMKITRIEPAGGGGRISLGLYFLIPTVFGVISLIIITKRRKTS